MATTYASVTVPNTGSAGVKLTGAAAAKSHQTFDPARPQYLVVQPTADIAVGASDVTAATGVVIAAGDVAVFPSLFEDLYAVGVAAATTAKVVRQIG